MTFTLQDLKHLEIMAELEERPASPSEELTVVEAVHAPETLTEKLLTLAAKLRTAGFVQQAESLESTFGMYKKAEVDANLLYRAHSETGDDLLEFAHPDGDIEIAPAQDHHGDVETPISQHKKIVDIVQKTAQLAGTIKNIIIAQKFQALLDAVSKNYLSSNGNDVLRDKKIQNFVAYASNIYDMAQRVVQTFNNAGETQRITAFATLKTIINAPGFKIDSVDDIDMFVETTLKTLEAGSPFKKAAIVNMLRESLNVKIAEDTADERQKEFADFKVVQLEIYKRVPEILKSISDKDSLNDLHLSNGKGGWGGWNDDASDYLARIRTMLGTAQWDYYEDYAKNGDLKARGKAVYWPDEILKSSVQFIKKLDEAAWNFKLDPSDHKIIAVAKSGIAALQHVWLTFYNKYISKDTAGAEYHSQFFTPGSLQRMFEKQSKKMRDIKYFITAGMMNDPSVMSSEPIKNYLTKLISMINTCESNFNQIVERAKKSGGTNPTAFSQEDNITTATLKSYITDPTLLSILNFKDITSFESTLNSLYLKIDSGLKGLINGNKEFDSRAREILNKLEITMGGK